MAYTLRKTKTFVHACELQSVDEAGKTHVGKLKVRFNAIPRAQWDELTNSADNDDRLLYDVVVNAIEDDIIADGSETKLSPDEALAAIREDLSLTGQVVDQGLEVMFGAAAKNARRSRRR